MPADTDHAVKKPSVQSTYLAPVVKASIPISDPLILTLGQIAREAGVRIYLVGGYVRDLLMDRSSKGDIDITVEGSGVDFARIVAAQFGSHAVVYERFGTALVPVGGYHLEFVGTRREVYHEGSRKPVVTEGTLEDDLHRRDFTVNAMAARIDGRAMAQVIDLFDGLADLQARVLRTPLDPHTTYSDDPLRMMRAARFSAQLGFQLHEDSRLAIIGMSERIKIISQERVSQEFLKLMQAPAPSTGLSLLFETGLLKIIFPELHRLEGVDLVKAGGIAYAHKNVFWHTLKVVDNAAQATDNVWLRFAALMHDVAKPVTKKFIEGTGWSFHGHDELGARRQEKIFRRMKLPLKEMAYVEKLVRLHHRPMALVDDGVTDSAIRRLIVDAGDDLDDLFTLCRADITSRDPRRVSRYLANYDKVIERIREVRQKDALRAFQSPVRGDEIMQICGLPPSRAVGVIKEAIEQAILDGLIPNQYQAAKEYLLKNMGELMSRVPAPPGQG